MTKRTDPFMGMDVTKLMSEFKLPGVDMTALTQAQQKNIDAVMAANQRAMQGMQELAARQAQILQETMTEAGKAAAALAADTSPDVKAREQMELAQQALNKALQDMRDIAELMTKSTNETFEVINKRVAESIDEARKLVEKSS
ncbi:MAG: TIGR01841 family phasin [Alphaproteobacteria bacterium]|nr:TIGR01841 family phasin [Alphaproteobacteria bacterium]